MKNSSIWVLTISVLVLSVVGLIMLTKQGGGPSTLSIPVSATDNFRGGENAKVILVEYSDFQCPACRSFAPHLDELSETLGEDLKLVYRHFPLPQHGNALSASFASEAGARQGKFWEMEKMLFERQNEWGEAPDARTLFEGYAQELGLNMEQYKKDVVSDEVKDKVEADRRGGIASKVNSTPSFFLNGERMTGYESFDQFKALINEAIQRTP